MENELMKDILLYGSIFIVFVVMLCGMILL